MFCLSSSRLDSDPFQRNRRFYGLDHNVTCKRWKPCVASRSQILSRTRAHTQTDIISLSKYLLHWSGSQQFLQQTHTCSIVEIARDFCVSFVVYILSLKMAEFERRQLSPAFTGTHNKVVRVSDINRHWGARTVVTFSPSFFSILNIHRNLRSYCEQIYRTRENSTLKDRLTKGYSISFKQININKLLTTFGEVCTLRLHKNFLLKKSCHNQSCQHICFILYTSSNRIRWLIIDIINSCTIACYCLMTCKHTRTHAYSQTSSPAFCFLIY